jgi:tape measure domain-containing protein
MRQAAQISESSAVKIQSQFDKITNKGKNMGASLNELKSRLDAVNQVRFSTLYAKEFDTATRAANRLERQIQQLENKGKAKTSSGGGILGDIIGGNLISMGIEKIGGSLYNQAIDTYRTSLKSSSLSTAINSTTNGQGNAAVAQTAAISDRYGLNYEASLEGVKTLTGGLKSMNMPLAEQMKIFEGVSTGIAAMKLGAEESKGAMLALGQMASKGTVSAEELRGQLGERIPGAFGIAAKSMNVTEAELGKMLQKGEIAAKDFLPKFAAEMQKTFGADALAAANGPQAIQERFNNAIFKMKAQIGEGFMPIITPIIQGFTKIAVEVMPYISEGLRNVVNFFSGINTETGVWAEWLNIIKMYAGIVWNGVSGIFKVVWNIVAAVGGWLANSKIIQDVFWAIGKIAEGVFAVVTKIGEALLWVWNNVIKPILDAIEKVYVKIKEITGFGKTPVKVEGTLNIPNVNPTSFAPASAETLIKEQPKGAVNPQSLQSNVANAKSESINQGGQRSVVINIAKQIEKIENHIIGGSQQVADEIESAIKEGLRRTMLSINSQASN